MDVGVVFFYMLSPEKKEEEKKLHQFFVETLIQGEIRKLRTVNYMEILLNMIFFIV